MNADRAALGLGALTGVLIAALAAPTAGAAPETAAPTLAAQLAPGVTAFWEMNEPSGTTVMTDSGPNGIHGTVNPSGVRSGVVVDGATAYNWVRRPPELAPASPERIIQ